MPIEPAGYEYGEVTAAVLKEPEALYSLPEKLNIYIDESGNLDNRQPTPVTTSSALFFMKATRKISPEKRQSSKRHLHARAIPGTASIPAL